MPRTEPSSEDKGKITVSKDMLWPVILIVALVVVMLVNGLFIYIAVSGADDVVPSYNQGER